MSGAGDGDGRVGRGRWECEWQLDGRLMDRDGGWVGGGWEDGDGIKEAGRTFLTACGPLCHGDRRWDSNPRDSI